MNGQRRLVSRGLPAFSDALPARRSRVTRTICDCRPPGVWDHLFASGMGPGSGSCSVGSVSMAVVRRGRQGRCRSVGGSGCWLVASCRLRPPWCWSGVFSATPARRRR